MEPRDPLTERFKHELREIDPDPKAWLEVPPKRRAPWQRYGDGSLKSIGLALAMGMVLWTLIGLVLWAGWWLIFK